MRTRRLSAVVDFDVFFEAKDPLTACEEARCSPLAFPRLAVRGGAIVYVAWGTSVMGRIALGSMPNTFL